MKTDQPNEKPKDSLNAFEPQKSKHEHLEQNIHDNYLQFSRFIKNEVLGYKIEEKYTNFIQFDDALLELNSKSKGKISIENIETLVFSGVLVPAVKIPIGVPFRRIATMVHDLLSKPFTKKQGEWKHSHGAIRNLMYRNHPKELIKRYKSIARFSNGDWCDPRNAVIFENDFFISFATDLFSYVDLYTFSDTMKHGYSTIKSLVIPGRSRFLYSDVVEDKNFIDKVRNLDPHDRDYIALNPFQTNGIFSVDPPVLFAKEFDNHYSKYLTAMHPASISALLSFSCYILQQDNLLSRKFKDLAKTRDIDIASYCSKDPADRNSIKKMVDLSLYILQQITKDVVSGQKECETSFLLPVFQAMLKLLPWLDMWIPIYLDKPNLGIRTGDIFFSRDDVESALKIVGDGFLYRNRYEIKNNVQAIFYRYHVLQIYVDEILKGYQSLKSAKTEPKISLWLDAIGEKAYERVAIDPLSIELRKPLGFGKTMDEGNKSGEEFLRQTIKKYVQETAHLTADMYKLKPKKKSHLSDSESSDSAEG
jgi:hypothetical protein